MNIEQLHQQINNSAPLDFGTVFGRSFELFKKVWLQGLITLLLTTICMVPIMFVVYIPMIALGMTNPEAMQSGDLSLPVIAGMVIVYFIIALLSFVVSTMLTAAFLRICKQVDFNETENNDYFYFFKKQFIRPTLNIALITLGLSVLGMLTCGLGFIYLMVPISLITAFFAFNEEVEPMDLVKASFALGNKNWFTIFLLIIVSALVAYMGIILCYFGMFLTLMFSKIPLYYIYKDAIGFEGNQELEEIGKF